MLLNWNDIVETSQGIAMVTNSFLDWAIEGVAKGGPLIESTFTSLEQSIRDATGVPDNSLVKKSSNASSDQKQSGYDTSVAVNTGTYHYEHSGVHQEVDALVVSPDPEVADFTSKVSDALADVQDQLNAIGEDFKKFFSGGEMSVGEFFKTVGVDILLLILRAIKGMAA